MTDKEIMPLFGLDLEEGSTFEIACRNVDRLRDVDMGSLPDPLKTRFIRLLHQWMHVRDIALLLEKHELEAACRKSE